MTRRAWVLALGAGLCGSLVPACTHTAIDAASGGPPAAALPAHDDRTVMTATPVGPAEPLRIPAAKAATPVAPVTLVAPDEPVRIPAAKAAAPDAQTERVKYQSLEPSPRKGMDLQPPPLVKRVSAPGTEEAEDSAPDDAPPVDKRKPKDEPPLLAVMRCFLEKRPDEAVGLLQRYDKTNQDLLLCLLPLAARLTEGSLRQADAQEMASIVDQLNTLAVPLRPRAALAIDKMCFCKTIETFGVYEPLEDDHGFRPGDRVHLYIELRNFSSEKRTVGPGQFLYVTHLASSAAIIDRAGLKVWPRDKGARIEFHREEPDESRTLRYDYFDHCQFCVPNLPPGTYQLSIQVTDEPTQRAVQGPLTFRVISGSAQGS